MEIDALSEEHLPDEYEVDVTSLDNANSEGPFLIASFELLKEARDLTALASGIVTEESMSGLSRNGAILCGHLVRMTKLMRTMIHNIVHGHGGDQQLPLMRQFLDSASTLIYLLGDEGDGGRYQSYLLDSLIAEREFLMDVRRQVARRGGERLPIEVRIERSIADTFAAAGLDETSIPSRRENGWPNAQERIRRLGPVAYAAYRTGSGSIHGTWHDLTRNHIEQVGDGLYVPNFDEATVRPQPMFAMALLGAECSLRYLEERFPDEAETLAPRYERFIAKLRDADQRHEHYLASHQAAD